MLKSDLLQPTQRPTLKERFDIVKDFVIIDTNKIFINKPLTYKWVGLYYLSCG